MDSAGAAGSSGGSRTVPLRRSARVGARNNAASSAASVSTITTSSSMVRAREAELKLKQDAAALEEKVDAARREIELLEHDVKFLMDKIEEVKGRQETPEVERKKLIQDLEDQIKEKTHEIGMKKISLKYIGKWAERDKSFLKEQQEINKLILEESLSQDLEGEDMANDSEWEEDFLSASGQQDSGEMPPSPETQQLMRDLVDLRGFETVPEVRSQSDIRLVSPVADPEVKKLDATENAVNSLAAALAEAMKTAVAGVQQKETKTEKLIARQTIKQDLTPFDGNPEEWPIFINQFKTVTEACGLSPVENLQRLQKGLKGEARECVRALLVAPENVDKIIDVLTRRYGDPEVVIIRLLKQAQQLTSVREGDYNGILKYSDVVRNLAATAVSMNCAPFISNPLLMTELVGKLPVSLQVDWTKEKRNLKKTFADLKDFAEWLEDLSEVYIKLCQPATSKRQYPQAAGRGKPSNVMVTEADRPRSGDVVEKKCLYCRESPHFIANCDEFKSISIEERWKFLREKKHCFICLQYGHSVSNCYRKKECGIGGCTRSHHHLLHKYEDNQLEGSGPLESIGTLGGASGAVNLMIVPVVLMGPAGEIKTFAMMDTGSTVTLLDEAIANRLGLHGPVKKLVFRGVNPSIQHEESRTVSLEIKGLGEKSIFKISGARTMKELNLPRQSVRRKTLKKWNHLKRVRIETFEDGKPTILIGQDHVDLILARRVLSGPQQAPVAAYTKLGWTLCGKINDHMQGNWTYHIREENGWEVLHQLMKSHMSLESMGVKVTTESGRCKEDKRAQEIMDSTISKVGEGWEAGLLWREGEIGLSSSKQLALTRLHQMERRMDRDPEFRQKYCDKIEEYQQKGFARRLTVEEALVENEKTFYIPHFMAKNPKKPKKLRFVFDAAAKVNSVSLNDRLLKGPDQLRSLPAVLMKFRQRKVGMTADIQDMFHRVKLIEEDKQAQRFLWRGDNRQREPDVYEMGVLIFGAACSPCIAQEVKNRNAKDFEDCFPSAAKAILEKFYVDDYLDSCDSVDEAVIIQNQVRKICSSGGFNLCNWISSHKEVMSEIPEELRATGYRSLDMEKEVNVERVLGMFWLPEKDKFTFSLNYVKAKEDVLTGARLPTKREFLSLFMTIYDPLGMLGNFTVKAKIMLQAAWRSQVGWDDDIPTSLSAAFQRWLDDLKNIEGFEVPRCYSLSFTSSDSVELHVFCDGSEEAFGTVAYFRVRTGDDVEVVLVSSKSRVAPLKSLSIPRLELQAALLGTRMAEFIKESHEVRTLRTVYWSDSYTVLRWVKSEGKRYQAFVAHRVGEIQEKTEAEEWRWIPTAENVADELTRLDSVTDFSPSSRWINGPSFLKSEEVKWPVMKTSEIVVSDEELEVKKDYVGMLIERRCLVDYEKCPNWMKLKRRMGQVFRFLRLYFKKTKSSSGLGVQDVAAGENYLLKYMQQDSFAEEIESLKKGNPIPASSRLKSLCVVLDSQGILRLRGRLDHARCLEENVKHPIVLDNKHPITRLIIAHEHEKGQHHGMERVVNELRQRFHILNIRAAVRSAWSSCQTCNNKRAVPVPPEMAVLPPERLMEGVMPFTVCGLDYFGPIEVTVGRHHEKRYGALFTCLSTRAVHIEVAQSLSTDSCIMALRRFFGLRGCPAEIWSDNGTNFRGAAVELKKALEELDQNKLTEECTSQGVIWKFIPPAAPHMGGSWERLVKSVKVALNSTLKERYPSDEVLNTLLVEAEHIVNSRPLTHVSVDPYDPEALTPNHFLLGRTSKVQAPGAFGKEDLCLRKKWRKAQALTNMFWSRWVKEFLPSLINREKWRKKTDPLKEGDIVLEADSRNPRNMWPMGKVVKVFPGTDGQVRVADVKFSSGVLRRPVVKLAKLDVRRHEDNSFDFQFGEEAAASSRAGECRRTNQDETSSEFFVSAAGGEMDGVQDKGQGGEAVGVEREGEEEDTARARGENVVVRE